MKPGSSFACSLVVLLVSVSPARSDDPCNAITLLDYFKCTHGTALAQTPIDSERVAAWTTGMAIGFFVTPKAGSVVLLNVRPSSSSGPPASYSMQAGSAQSKREQLPGGSTQVERSKKGKTLQLSATASKRGTARVALYSGGTLVHECPVGAGGFSARFTHWPNVLGASPGPKAGVVYLWKLPAPEAVSLADGTSGTGDELRVTVGGAAVSGIAPLLYRATGMDTLFVSGVPAPEEAMRAK